MEEFKSFIINDLFEQQSSILDDKDKVCYLEYDDAYTLSPKCKIKHRMNGGLYEVISNREGLFFIKKDVVLDEYIDLNNSTEDVIIDDIFKFKDKAELFKSNGVVHKRGILLHGPPGCGKTSFIGSFMQKFIKSGGLVFLTRNTTQLVNTIEGLKQIQSINPDQNFVLIVEEIDKYDSLQELQNFLDGQDSLQHIITIGTTNAIQDLPTSLLRPSRFDWIIEFGKLSKDARKKYLESKKVQFDIDLWVGDTDGFTVAQLKELFISVCLLDNDYEKSLSKIRDAEKHGTINGYNKSIGFKK